MCIQYQDEMEGMYENIQENCLKSMRRGQTKVGTKFNWDKKPDVIA